MSTVFIPRSRTSSSRSRPSWAARLRARYRGMRPRTRWLNLALLVALAAAIWLAVQAVGGPQAPPPEVRTVAVVRGPVTSTVTGSGNAESAQSTPVNFAVSGTVTAVNVQPGDTVTTGQVLATIDDGSARAALRTAQAQYDNAAAALAQAEAGPTEVGKQQDALAITQAQQALDNARVSVDAAKAQLALDDESTRTAIENAEEQLDNDRESTGQAVADAKAKLATDTTAQNALVSAAEADERTACSGSAAAPAGDDAGTGTSAGSSCATAKRATTTAKNTRTSTLQADRQAITTAEQTRESTLDKDEQAITTAEQTRETTLLADENAVTTAEQSVTTAEGNLTSAQLTAQANLNPQTPAQIAQARANVDSAQVTVDTAQADLDATVLVAPQDGVVLAVSGEVGLSSSASGSGAGAASAATGSGGASGGGSGGGSGATASTASTAAGSAGEGFIVIANLSALAVTANVPEADAATVELGQPATVTFPGTGTTAAGTVTRVDPQSTVVNNVVLYPITISLETAPPGVGVGSTAELSITTGTAQNVLKVPTQAVTTTGDRHTVTVLRDGVETVVPVQIGVSGTTDTEITSGVAVGDQLVLPGTGPTTGTG
ncbi:HlyD family efflux transporter periplasmic adaptor subunit [Pseudonocardia humida]|uniref:HlyD family efflux transporter periplasmic adaptor subunit n=1 Tax=Pseudonocardia humida TaxID=2800819 RepID=A0ABT1A6G7_9PSEU|nr:biotin/lipoyl-binding protein [Pseudonocardia humida]MCO1658565.1 HlyD family efflux transporter periplasmic adaptor subunit [Pseudonocardia humida]